jgi:hypothetical protein
MSGDLEHELFRRRQVEEMEIISALLRVPLALRRGPQIDLNLQRPSDRRIAGLPESGIAG